MKLLRSFRFAFNGLGYALRTQQNFRIHLVILLGVVIAGGVLRVNKTEWMFIIVCAMLVLILELVNTALEYLCDVVTTELHPGIKIIKDVSAAAVLLGAIGSVVVGLIIFLPKLATLIL
jgi:diacylglycerol kinase (ATP)